MSVVACDGGHVVYTSLPPPPPPPPIVYDEGEPNDAAWIAPWFGSLYPGESVRVAGYVTDDGSDPQDGLAFTAYGPCRIDFTLLVDDPFANLDVWLYEPELGVFTAAFASAYHDECGSIWFDAPATDFHLVVFSAYGASPWRLLVEAHGSGLAALAADTHANARSDAPDAIEAERTVASALDVPSLVSPAPTVEPARMPALPRSLRLYARGAEDGARDDDTELDDPVLDGRALGWIEPNVDRLPD